MCLIAFQVCISIQYFSHQIFFIMNKIYKIKFKISDEHEFGFLGKHFANLHCELMTDFVSHVTHYHFISLEHLRQIGKKNTLHLLDYNRLQIYEQDTADLQTTKITISRLTQAKTISN